MPKVSRVLPDLTRLTVTRWSQTNYQAVCVESFDHIPTGMFISYPFISHLSTHMHFLWSLCQHSWKALCPGCFHPIVSCFVSICFCVWTQSNLMILHTFFLIFSLFTFFSSLRRLYFQSLWEVTKSPNKMQFPGRACRVGEKSQSWGCRDRPRERGRCWRHGSVVDILLKSLL